MLVQIVLKRNMKSVLLYFTFVVVRSANSEQNAEIC